MCHISQGTLAVHGWNGQLQNEASVLQLHQSEHFSHHLPTFTYQDNTILLSLLVRRYAASTSLLDSQLSCSQLVWMCA